MTNLSLNMQHGTTWFNKIIDFFLFASPVSQNGIEVQNLIIVPANLYQGGITVKYKAAYFLALEAESAANLITIPVLKESTSTVLFSSQQIYLGVAVLVGLIGLGIMLVYGGTPPPGGDRLLDPSVSSVTSRSCDSTVNIPVQSALSHSGIDTSTAVSSDVVTMGLVDGGGSMLSTQSSIAQVLLAEPALTGIVDPALVEAGTSLALASAAVLTTSVLPEVAAATLPLLPLLETELGLFYHTFKNLTTAIITNYMQYECLNNEGVPPLTDTIKLLSNPQLSIMRNQLLLMGYDLSGYDVRFAPLTDGSVQMPLGNFIFKHVDVLFTICAQKFPNVDLTPTLYNDALTEVYDIVLNRLNRMDVDLLNKFPRRRP